MGAFLKLISSPLGDIFDKVGKIIDNVHLSGEEKLAAQRALLEIQTAAHIRMAELDADWAKTQASVITAEIQSDSWMGRSWRPIMMLTFVYIIGHTYILAPLFSLPSVGIPPDMWDLLKIGMGGYIVGRSAEKMAPAITEIVVANRKK